MNYTSNYATYKTLESYRLKYRRFRISFVNISFAIFGMIESVLEGKFDNKRYEF